MNECYSTSYINGSPFQAWRAGFREGVKMSLDRGTKAADIKRVWWQNYQRLLIWCNVGADIKNGIWAMYGARLGCYLTACTDWDYIQVRDFEYLKDYWKNHVEKIGVEDELEGIGNNLRQNLNLEIAELNADASRFFKSVYQNTPRILNR